ncbi:hypothetical protein EC988_008623, partial [Linderina pennispora]
MVPPRQMRPAPRYDTLCVFVVESTQRMQNLFPDLYETVIKQVITQLRTPVLVEPASKKVPATKATPCVKLGVVFFGDYFPYSTRTCSSQYFTSNYREFAKSLKAHRFRGGGRLRCASTEGLVGALEMLDDFEENDPEAHLLNVQQRHVILVTSTPPYAEKCRENVHMRYDNFGLDDVGRRMREMRLSFSLVLQRGQKIDDVEALMTSANYSTKAPLVLPLAMSPNFDVRLTNISLPMASTSTPTSTSEATPSARPQASIAPAQPPK